MTHRPAAPALAAALAEATRLAAVAALPFVGSGDWEAVDAAAVAAMRAALADAPADGRVVVGEGEKDEAPMLHLGERFGNGRGPAIDLAVDPVDGTSLAAAGLPGSMAIMAVAPRGAFLDIGPAHYMRKLVSRVPGLRVGAPVGETVAAIAAARGVPVSEVRVAVQDRPRNAALARAAEDAGAAVEGFVHGDVERCLRAARADGGLDLVVGIGGAPEGILTAAAVRALGGWMQARLEPQSAREAERLAEAGIPVDRVVGLDELCAAPAAVFLTAVTPCDLGPGSRLAPGDSWRAGSVDAT
ncbi:fructose-1,6-bisphosphatase II [Agromyces flavus]|uniref:Fructose-1,6-bisphosphatase class 2 n=1 Tax=Agromyces flavus TaxID=589382 RepID=A0A1H1N736_9MICO|nr:fructose-bisphosphatase class II [Agromyces flavus]MCP2369145.1 fructose-1,6-bisphosphatase II [Agromyces flavus]GGI48626.1 fructose-1,6-bisphosphatase [Agromyces flavus]SDR94688.1 fructose-1,6-bisphosphatase II [Agromyces flavus]